MAYSIKKLEKRAYPQGLLEIPEPPKALWYAGEKPDENRTLIAFVGSRKYTPYGRTSCVHIIEGLKNYPVTIVSGLAYGIDSIAHRTALDVGLPTIAIPGSGLDPRVIYPRAHANLAEEIVNKGGTLISELDPTQSAAAWTFPARNRIMAGISQAIVVIEAEIPSGTLITSRLGTEYNKEVLAVPGDIFSPQSKGSNMLISLGASVCRSGEDILRALGIPLREHRETLIDIESRTDDEKLILSLLTNPKSRSDLLRETNLNFQRCNIALMQLELDSIIEEHMGEIRKKE